MNHRVLPLERDHDLPPRWDDNPVTWQGWCSAPSATTWELHHRGPREECEACGCARPPINRGTVRAPGLSLAGTAVSRPGEVIGTLIAIRCPDCLQTGPVLL